MILAGLTLLGLLTICVFFYRAGSKKEKLNQVKNDLKAVQDAKKVEDDINSLNDADIGKRMSKWTR